MSRETGAPRNRSVSTMLSELPNWMRARAFRKAAVPGAQARTASDTQDALRSVLERRLIFVISTGRSGTEYLTQVLGLFQSVHAEHEPEPSFTNAFRTIAAAPHLARQFWLDHKLPAIARSPAPIYAETSHLACKGFLESGIELGLRPTLVHLVRPYRDTARSMLALDTIPTRTYKGVRFYLGPDDRVFLPVPRAVFERWHDYQLCYWYCLEIGERARVYAERFRPLGVAVERVDLDDICAPAGIHELGARLNVGPLSKTGTRRLGVVVGQRTNQKTKAKRPDALSDSKLAAWEREVETAVASRAHRDSAGGLAPGRPEPQDALITARWP
jgi:hypothetical protein